uniref:Uncharacterized protein n=1 Tax=Oryza punctata TaxID=4537 RepID=A0A0E0LTE3_ORYPU
MLAGELVQKLTWHDAFGCFKLIQICMFYDVTQIAYDNTSFVGLNVDSPTYWSAYMDKSSRVARQASVLEPHGGFPMGTGSFTGSHISMAYYMNEMDYLQPDHTSFLDFLNMQF